eukprot:gene13861-biopygen9120
MQSPSQCRPASPGRGGPRSQTQPHPQPRPHPEGREGGGGVLCLGTSLRASGGERRASAASSSPERSYNFPERAHTACVVDGQQRRG